jgi:hypothetical protein
MYLRIRYSTTPGRAATLPLAALASLAALFAAAAAFPRLWRSLDSAGVAPLMGVLVAGGVGLLAWLLASLSVRRNAPQPVPANDNPSMERRHAFWLLPQDRGCATSGPGIRIPGHGE